MKPDKRKTENGHLDLKGYMLWSGIIDDYNETPKGNNMLLILSPRDIGKTTACFNYVKYDYWPKSNWKNKLAFLRNDTIKLKNFMRSFNAYNNEYVMTDSGIYRILKDENDKIIQKDYIGMNIALSCYENAKSTITEDFKLVIWDEFNEEDTDTDINWIKAKQQHKLLNALIDTIKTLERHRDGFTLLIMGNKVSTQNDILLTFDIEIENDDEDQLIIRDKWIDGKLFKIRFVIIGNNTFKNLKSYQSLANAIASYDDDADRYLNRGGFLQDGEKDVLSWSRIKDNTCPLKYLVFDNFYFEYGKISNKFYIHNVKKPALDIPILALNMKGFITDKNSTLSDQDDYVDFFEMLAYQMKYQQLWYTSNFAKKAILNILQLYLEMENL